jgi:hypothetical protein
MVLQAYRLDRHGLRALVQQNGILSSASFCPCRQGASPKAFSRPIFGPKFILTVLYVYLIVPLLTLQPDQH